MSVEVPWEADANIELKGTEIDYGRASVQDKEEGEQEQTDLDAGLTPGWRRQRKEESVGRDSD